MCAPTTRDATAAVEKMLINFRIKFFSPEPRCDVFGKGLYARGFNGIFFFFFIFYQLFPRTLIYAREFFLPLDNPEGVSLTRRPLARTGAPVRGYPAGCHARNAIATYNPPPPRYRNTYGPLHPRISDLAVAGTVTDPIRMTTNHWARQYVSVVMQRRNRAIRIFGVNRRQQEHTATGRWNSRARPSAGPPAYCRHPQDRTFTRARGTL